MTNIEIIEALAVGTGAMVWGFIVFSTIMWVIV